ncbi:response regulator transcription factor [Conexibacter stalactiti]|uniref:Response regulator transcription factor n=2 Tax=Conexibacter stalactiti TaxID=1940611 RepID=A0ABU4I046_9ACTN|nr:response regulator transcription factor [Conexibacter stalactiti]MEC5039186.1 response regulator transcription factor [Conexibacter stalactiti]
MRVALITPRVLLREGLALLLTDAGLDVVARCGDAAELVRLTRGGPAPDVTIVDVGDAPGHGEDGVRAAAAIRAQLPASGLLVLARQVEVALALQLLAGSAVGVGYLLEGRIDAVGDFVDAVRRVGAGGSVLDPGVVAALRRDGRGDDPLGELTARERAVLELIAAGRSNHGIAELLAISPRTAEKHVSSIFEKLELSSARGRSRRVLAVLLRLGAAEGGPLGERAGRQLVPDRGTGGGPLGGRVGAEAVKAAARRGADDSRFGRSTTAENPRFDRAEVGS